MADASVAAASFPSREERRTSHLSGWLKRVDGQFADFTLVDLSYGGCRIRTEAPLCRGERVSLSFPGRGLIEAAVRWWRGDEFGMTFAVTGEDTQTPRQVERLQTRLSVAVRRAGRRSQWIEAHDISPHGCCLEFVEMPRVGDLLFVQLPGLEAIEARVRWVEGYRAGVEFARPVHPAVFDLLQERWRG
ncbi:hypothetical protein GCM10022281_13070 [Sphingomonas rosea]|uniref:PilZ domain-containing protein n=1 Tax=Sphingomonas rosea TaxID=335605 RepID=A0ABP7U1E9_9SPHN